MLEEHGRDASSSRLGEAPLLHLAPLVSPKTSIHALTEVCL